VLTVNEFNVVLQGDVDENVQTCLLSTKTVPVIGGGKLAGIVACTRTPPLAEYHFDPFAGLDTVIEQGSPSVARAVATLIKIVNKSDAKFRTESRLPSSLNESKTFIRSLTISKLFLGLRL
jgi:hypothetical protein